MFRFMCWVCNPDMLVVCMDEKLYQMLDNCLELLPVRPVFVESLSGRRASVQEHRTVEDWDLKIKHLLTECYPCHEKSFW